MSSEPVSIPEIRQALIDARALVEWGWIKGQNVYAASFYCARGACRAAAPDFPTGDAALATLSLYLEEHWFGSVVKFNDHHTTTHKDVLDLFDRAIDSLDRTGE